MVNPKSRIERLLALYKAFASCNRLQKQMLHSPDLVTVSKLLHMPQLLFHFAIYIDKFALNKV